MVQDSRLPLSRGTWSLGGSSALMSRMHQSDMRPAVITIAFFALLWTLASSISCFRNVPVFNSNHASKLALFYIISGAIYMGVVVIEFFGIFAAASRRVAFVRIFAYLSILVTLMIAAAGIIRTIVHFSLKSEILNVCDNVNAGDHIFFTGFFGPVDGGVITPAEAQQWCIRQFDRDSLSNIVALLVTLAVSAVFVLFVFAYLRQLHNPTSVINREPARMDAYPAHYNPPYNSSYNSAFQYQAPNGPPPNMSVDTFVPPYEGVDTKLPTYEGGDYKGEFGDRKDDPFS